jgi:hypothetical protein
MPTRIASIETISRYRSSRKCSKSVIAPSGGTGGGFSHFKLKWIGRPLIVKDTALRAYGQTSLRLSVAEGSWLARGGCW